MKDKKEVLSKLGSRDCILLDEGIKVKCSKCNFNEICLKVDTK